MTGPGLPGARERTETLLAQIGERNPVEHIFTAVLTAEALAEADAADARRRNGSVIGPLDGCSIAIKDNVDVRGQPTSAGICHYRNATASADAPLVRSLRAAGGIIVGKTNMHEAALGVTTDNPWFGRCDNPRHPGYSPGGSSGGSAAAVAAGLCDLALGTDSMGSIRIPAACCGVAGLVPTREPAWMQGVMPLSPRLDAAGLLAASAADLCLAWHALQGTLPAEPLQPRRVGVLRRFPGVALHPAVAGMMARAATYLNRAGIDANEMSADFLNLPQLRTDCFILCEIEAASWHAQALASNPGDFSEDLRRMLAYGKRQTPQCRAAILQRLDAARDRLLPLFEEVDVLVLPTTPQLPFRHGTPPPHDMADLTVIANIAGLPAISIPWGMTPDGLPLSLQLLAGPGNDARLLDAARLMEQCRAT